MATDSSMVVVSPRSNAAAGALAGHWNRIATEVRWVTISRLLTSRSSSLPLVGTVTLEVLCRDMKKPLSGTRAVELALTMSFSAIESIVSALQRNRP